jgi:hypothetical protein
MDESFISKKLDLIASREPSVMARLREATSLFDRETPLLNHNPQESQARWTAIMMRNMVAQQGKNLVEVITERVKTLESALQDGESLVVFCDAGQEQIRVEGFEFPNWHLAIVSGTDAQDNKSYRIENVQDIKLTCKVVKGVEKKPIGFILPKEPEKTK